MNSVISLDLEVNPHAEHIEMTTDELVVNFKDGRRLSVPCHGFLVFYTLPMRSADTGNCWAMEREFINPIWMKKSVSLAYCVASAPCESAVLYDVPRSESLCPFAAVTSWPSPLLQQ